MKDQNNTIHILNSPNHCNMQPVPSTIKDPTVNLCVNLYRLVIMDFSHKPLGFCSAGRFVGIDLILYFEHRSGKRNRQLSLIYADGVAALLGIKQQVNRTDVRLRWRQRLLPHCIRGGAGSLWEIQFSESEVSQRRLFPFG